MNVDREKLERLNKMASQVRTGGKGSMRRKRKAHHKSIKVDDRQIQSSLQRMGLNEIPGVEEVNFFKENGDVVHFGTPRVQAAVDANTYVINGPNETKPMAEMLRTNPEIISQIGANLDSLSRLAQQLKARQESEGGTLGDDDEIPDVENFDEILQKDVEGQAEAEDIAATD